MKCCVFERTAHVLIMRSSTGLLNRTKIASDPIFAIRKCESLAANSVTLPVSRSL